MLFILHSVVLYEIFTTSWKTKMKEMMLMMNAALLNALIISKIIEVKLAKPQHWGVM